MSIRANSRFPAALLALSIPCAAYADDVIDEIVVTADYRERAISELPASVTVLDAEFVEDVAVQHFEELVNVVPNLNWSGDGHRARYFQIRGVGELEQYQGAPNPSVGFLIDDIDFSGIGTIATLFDIEQVEVLRGPQGSRYGANALAGLIYMRSAMPTPEWSGKIQVSAGDDDTFAGGVAVGGPLARDGSAMFRGSAHHHRSSGFRDNPYLGRDDTNGRDETTLRGRLLWLPNDNWRLNVAMVFADVDNGYDAFAIDNSYTMLSDKPGRDAQRSVGGSLSMEWFGPEELTLTSVTTAADSDIDFSFDADWGNADSWAPVTYDYVSLNDRKRETLSQEFRLNAESWLVGVYALRLDDELATINRGEYFDPFFDFADSLDDSFFSDYSATNIAAFGQTEHALGPRTRISAGLRIERRTSDYGDSSGLTTGPSETMAGGEVALLHDLTDSLTGFVSLSKGFKAGGFNLGLVPDDRREFEAESLWNLEAGVKATLPALGLTANLTIFHQRRDDQQVRTSFQLVPGDPASFVFFTDNAAEGKATGLETDIAWQMTATWSLYAALGLLDATFAEFVTPQVDLTGREQAHAPRYTLASGISYRHHRGLFARVDVTARDDFYFDVSHDQRSKSYALVNARIGYEGDSWSAQFWGRNLFDRDYAVRGFFFGNEPPDFPNALYTRKGDPRHVGVTFDWRF